MALTFMNFKQVIPAKILTRGYDYFSMERVTDLSMEDEGIWTAEVEGTEAYDVQISLGPKQELTCVCTCPYEFGEQCKHVAAVLYAIEKAFPEYIEGRQRKPAPKQPTRLARLNLALKAASHGELVAVLLELCADDRDLLTKLLIRLEPTGNAEVDYRRLIKEALRPPRGSHGYLDYRAATEASKRVDKIADQADKTMAARPEQALMIYQAILEEASTALGQADDSNGMLGGNVERALNGLAECAERLAGPDRDALLHYCLNQATNSQFEGWDYRWSLLEVAADLIDSPVQRAALFATLDSIAGRNKTDVYLVTDFSAVSAATIKLKVIRRQDGEEAELAFIAANKHLHPFRKVLINNYINSGDLDAARSLAEEGLMSLKGAGTFQHGTALEYRKLLLTIAQQQGIQEAIREQARVLWLSRRGAEYYAILKDTVPATEWPDFLHRILTSKDCSRDLAAWAYAQEGSWQEVCDLVMSQPSLLPAYQRELEARFPEEMVTAYELWVEEMLKPVTNRSTYSEAANLLMRLQKLGRAEKAKALAKSLCERYPQRRAMIDELHRVISD